MIRMFAVAFAIGLASGCTPAPPAPSASVAAPATVPITASVASELPTLVNGMYLEHGACPGEGCYFGRMQATGEMVLYAAPASSPAIVGKVMKDEWLDTVTTEARYAPARGTVTADAPPLKTGDVVYQLSNEGEGCFIVWDRGEHASWCDDGATPPSGIAWDKEAPKEDGSQGLWVQVKRANGPGGWLRDPKELRCIGYQDRDADCPPLPR